MIVFVGAIVLFAGSWFIVSFYQRHMNDKTDYGFKVQGYDGPIFLGARDTNCAYKDAMDVCEELSEVAEGR